MTGWAGLLRPLMDRVAEALPAVRAGLSPARGPAR
jgi:hypothetical protein